LVVILKTKVIALEREKDSKSNHRAPNFGYLEGNMKAIESEERPWGRFFVIHDQPTYKLKRIEVDPGGRLSYQFHHKRSEAWTIIDGVGEITLNGKTKEYKAGETILIPQGVKHRIENKKSEKIVFIEVQTGTYFGEDDIVRIKDDYNRV